jgi:hypothetical protein
MYATTPAARKCAFRTLPHARTVSRRATNVSKIIAELHGYVRFALSSLIQLQVT